MWTRRFENACPWWNNISDKPFYRCFMVIGHCYIIIEIIFIKRRFVWTPFFSVSNSTCRFYFLFCKKNVFSNQKQLFELIVSDGWMVLNLYENCCGWQLWSSILHTTYIYMRETKFLLPLSSMPKYKMAYKDNWKITIQGYQYTEFNDLKFNNEILNSWLIKKKNKKPRAHYVWREIY